MTQSTCIQKNSHVAQTCLTLCLLCHRPQVDFYFYHFLWFFSNESSTTKWVTKLLDYLFSTLSASLHGLHVIWNVREIRILDRKILQCDKWHDICTFSIQRKYYSSIDCNLFDLCQVGTK